ncbi:mitochondrial mRNA pseudouridine synthase Trub2 isoform X1 [Huso huso]|uniref:Mitochondrial mRNA pseudouridine synthase Trub2 isoform X1 n=1 Tax=Huso huso TaxID=61971 RepID=A0ABR0Z7S2_HUSHU
MVIKLFLTVLLGWYRNILCPGCVGMVIKLFLTVLLGWYRNILCAGCVGMVIKLFLTVLLGWYRNILCPGCGYGAAGLVEYPVPCYCSVLLGWYRNILCAGCVGMVIKLFLTVLLGWYRNILCPGCVGMVIKLLLTVLLGCSSAGKVSQEPISFMHLHATINLILRAEKLNHGCLAMGSAARAYRSLQGLFAVYKPPGVHWKLVRDTVETSLIRDLNSLGSPAPRQAIRFLPGRCEGTDRSELTLTAARLPVLADHPLVKGPEFHRLKVGAGHRLDVRSSGVFVLGVGHGNKLLTDMYSCHLPKRGVWGLGTAVQQRGVCTGAGVGSAAARGLHVQHGAVQGVRALCSEAGCSRSCRFSGVDLKSQEAYELAVKGLLRPLQKTPPIITGVRCVRFAPPEFTLEIQCLNETPQYLRKLIHEIGLELRSAAVCSHVRRTRDGFFTLPDALLRSHWDLRSVGEAVRQAGPRVRAALSLGEAEPEAEPGQG